MAEKFLVLGANSFYGSNFVKLLREKGAYVREISKPGYNILNPGGWVLCAEEDETVVNFISQSSVVESWDNPGLWLRVNAEATTNLFDQLRQKKIAKFVHVSTPEVYGSTLHWVDEDCAFNPTTPYAVSRAAGDMMLMAYHKAYGFPAIITRTANIYGEGQQDYRIIPKAQRYKKERKSLPLHGNGQSRRSFIHVGDAVNALYVLCREGTPGESYHISTQKAHSIREVVDLIGCETVEAPDRLGKDEAYLLDSTKIRSMGWKDTIKLEDWICEQSR